MQLNLPITCIKGIGEKKAKEYAALGINSVNDLVMYFPCSYKDRGKVVNINTAEVNQRILTEAVFVGAKRTQYIKKGFTKTVLTFNGDEYGFTCVYYNFAYISSAFTPGGTYRLYGLVGLNGKNKCLINPQSERAESVRYLKEGLYAVYPLMYKSKIKQREISEAIKAVLTDTEFGEDMPLKLILKAKLSSKADSLKSIHFPYDEMQAQQARRYFCLEKFLVLRAVAEKKSLKTDKEAFGFTDVSEFTKQLGFFLTEDQNKAIADIVSDVTSKKRMVRLINGDVGCGKTAVAMAAAYLSAKNNYQTAICAPTQVLIKQHYDKYSALFEKLNIGCVLLTSKMSASERKAALELIANKDNLIIFGTHALFSGDVVYKNLNLAVIDEQQRYGVSQRASLEQKGNSPHILVMSATPIPRTLALGIYSDLSMSVIEQMPKNRAQIKTFVVNATHRMRILELIKQKAAMGLKTYIVCPAIDSEDMENVEENYLKLKEELKGINLVKLTGNMDSNTATKAMQSFTNGASPVIVSTTVIEVGVDDPLAVVMWVYGAERFGLSQLHQLRGRVGRGIHTSYCFLEPSSHLTGAPKRLSIVKNTQNGFEIAKQDLELRGSGELFGYSQSGEGDSIINDMIKFSSLYSDSAEIYDYLKSSNSERDCEYFEYIKQRADNDYSDLVMN